MNSIRAASSSSVAMPEKAERRSFNRAIGADQLAAGDPSLGVLVHERDQGAQRISLDDVIGVEQQDVLRNVGRPQCRRDDRVVAPVNPRFGEMTVRSSHDAQPCSAIAARS